MDIWSEKNANIIMKNIFFLLFTISSSYLLWMCIWLFTYLLLSFYSGMIFCCHFGVPIPNLIGLFFKKKGNQKKTPAVLQALWSTWHISLESVLYFCSLSSTEIFTVNTEHIQSEKPHLSLISLWRGNSISTLTSTVLKDDLCCSIKTVEK